MAEMLINYGVLGAVLAWFMYRMEKKIDELTKVIAELCTSVKALKT